MEGALTAPQTRVLGWRWSVEPRALCAWLLPAALVTYLGLRSGGYDTIIADQVGIAAWWLAFLILALGLVPIRLTGPAWVGLGLLSAFAAWTTLSLIWTDSPERTMGDVTLMLLYVALALVTFLIRGRDTARLMLNGLTVAVVTIGVVALLSRLHFAWFAVPEVAQNLPNEAHRLSYPIGYWNALGALMAIGVALALYVATGARTLVARAAAAGAVPLLTLCTYLTASRGGALETGIAVVLFLVLAPNRLPKLAVALCSGAGSALLIDAAQQRPAVRDGLRTATAAHQGDQLLAIAVAVFVGVALLAYAIMLIERHVERPSWLIVPSPRRLAVLTVAVLAVGVAVFLAAGGSGFVSRQWAQFKTQPPANVNVGTTLQRFGNGTGNGRYQLWQSAARAARRHPWTGTGAGTFVYWWAADGNNLGGYVQDAHSLYMQTLGELGYPGLLLIVAFIGWILIWGVTSVLRARDPDRRLVLAGATAGAATFAVAAAFEWIWLIPVLPAVLLMLAAVIFSSGDAELAVSGRTAAKSWRYRGPLARGGRVVAALVALGAVVVIALPMAATADVRDSQALARTGNLAGALASAREAVRLQPSGATPRLQEALVLEAAGDLGGALGDARRATGLAPTYSDTWLVRSRLEARIGNARAALADYLHARSLNPHSKLFTR